MALYNTAINLSITKTVLRYLCDAVSSFVETLHMIQRSRKAGATMVDNEVADVYVDPGTGGAMINNGLLCNSNCVEGSFSSSCSAASGTTTC